MFRKSMIPVVLFLLITLCGYKFNGKVIHGETTFPWLSMAMADAASLGVPADYSTIQAAIDAASPGDSILVADGEYVESITINKSLILESENGYESTVIREPEGGCVSLVSIQSDDVTVRGFSLRGEECDGFRIASEDGVDDGVVHRRCVLENNLTDVENNGIFAEGGNHRFLGNRCMNGTDWWAAGIFIINSDRDAVIGNICSDNKAGMTIISSFDGSWDHMQDADNFVTIKDNLLENNRTGAFVDGSYHIFSGNTLRNNSKDAYFDGYRISVSGNSFDADIQLQGTECEAVLNDFKGLEFNLETQQDDDILFATKNVMYRFGGKTLFGILGNFISSHDFPDNDGNGLADTGLALDPYNIIPVLSSPSMNYGLVFKGAGLSGCVLHKDGTPVQGVTVSLSGPGEPSVVTDSGGNYRFEELESGIYRIDLAKEGYFFPCRTFYVTLDNDGTQALPAECADLSAVAQNTVHVPGDYSTIQDAVNGVQDGDIIRVASGTYPEDVIIDKSVALISDEGADSTFITGTEYGGVFIGADQVTVQGFSVVAYICLGYYPIVNQTSSYTTVRGNRCRLIYVNGGRENIIAENTGSEDDLKGLSLSMVNTYDSIVSGNLFSSQDEGSTGMTLQYGSGNVVRNNTFTGNDTGMHISSFGGNYVFLNRFENNVQADISINGIFSNQTFQSPEMLSYTYGGNVFVGYLGNYYADHDLTDTDGNGIADAAYVIGDSGESSISDLFPLAGPPEGYVFP